MVYNQIEVTMKQEIKEFLDSHANKEKAEFDSKIVKSTLPILGIKTCDLEKFAKILAKGGVGLNDFDFLCHEEVILAGMIIGYKKCSTKEKVTLLEQIFSYFDNWAVVDTIVPRLKGMESERWYFENLLKSDKEFVRRTGIIFLMKFALSSDLERVVNLMKDAINDHYYVKMAIAWCYSEAFIKDYDFMKDFIQSIDDKFVRNKSIQKACESFRLTSEEKSQIRQLKI